mgnify:CR=1 FL=1
MVVFYYIKIKFNIDFNIIKCYINIIKGVMLYEYNSRMDK